MRQFFLLALISMFYPAFAQTPAIEWFAPQEVGQIAGVTSSGYYVVERKTGPREDVLMKYDLKGKLLSTVVFGENYLGTAGFLNRVITTKNGTEVALFEQIESAKRILYGQKLTGEGKLNGSKVSIVETNKGGSGPYASLGSFGFEISEDRSKVLASAWISTSKKECNKLFAVFDEDFKVLWKKEQLFKEDINSFDVADVALANDGSAVALTKSKTDEKTRWGSDIYTKWKVYCFSAGTQAEGEVKVNGENVIRHACIGATASGGFVVAGLFVSKNDIDWHLWGSTLSKIDLKDGNAQIVYQEKFAAQPGYVPHKVIDVRNTSDGNLAVIFWDYAADVTHGGDNGLITSYGSGHASFGYEDQSVILFDKEYKKIYELQARHSCTSLKQEDVGNACAVQGNTVVSVYNQGTEKNGNIETYIAVVDSKGNEKITPLNVKCRPLAYLEAEDLKMSRIFCFAPMQNSKETGIISDNKFLIRTYEKKQYKFGVVTLK